MDEFSDKLEKYFKRGVNYEYFFNNISSPDLLPKLVEAGYYKTPLKPIKKGGYFYYSRWAPAEFLIKIADKKPEDVMKLILSLPATDNVSVNVQYLEAAMKMPPKIAKRINKRVLTWTSLLPAFRLSYALADLLTFYINNDELESAIELLKILLKLNKPSNPDKLLIKHPEPLIDRHEFEGLLEKQIPELFKKSPTEVTDLLIKTLRDALGIEEKNNADDDGLINDYSEIWLSNFNRPNLNSHITVKIATCLYRQLSAIKTDTDQFKTLVMKLSKEKYKVFQRMAAALIGEGSKDSELKKIYTDKVKRWGKPNILGMGEFTSWTGPESPISIEEARNKTLDELMEYLKSWEPSGEIMSPSKEGLARVISQLVEEDSSVGLSLLQNYLDLAPVYTSHVLQSFRMSSDNKKLLNWPEIITAVATIIQKDFKDNENDNWQLNSLLSLIESGLNHDQIDLTLDSNRKVVMSTIAKGLKSTDPSAEREKKLKMEPDTLAINSTRGTALLTLIRYLKAFSRQHKSARDALSKLPKAELEEIDKLLDYYVNVDSEPTLAVRTAFAQELPFLYYAHKEWVTENLDNIFPKSLPYFKANIESLILFTRPHQEAVKVIHPYLLRYLQQLRMKNIKLDDSHTKTELVAHIMVYYLNGYTEYDDPIIKELNSLPASYVGTAIEFIGRNLRDLDYAKDKDLFSRGQAYWDNRVKEGLKREEAEQFAWWFICDGLDIDWRVKNMSLALHKCSEVEALWFVMDWLEKNSDELPAVAVKILKEIVTTQSDEKLQYLLYKETKKILSNLYANQDKNIKSQARDIIERLLAKGFVDYKDII